MVWYEKGYCELRVKIFSMRTGKSRTLETSRNLSSFTYSRMKMGIHHHVEADKRGQMGAAAPLPQIFKTQILYVFS